MKKFIIKHANQIDEVMSFFSKILLTSFLLFIFALIESILTAIPYSIFIQPLDSVDRSSLIPYLEIIGYVAIFFIIFFLFRLGISNLSLKDIEKNSNSFILLLFFSSILIFCYSLSRKKFDIFMNWSLISFFIFNIVIYFYCLKIRAWLYETDESYGRTIKSMNKDNFRILLSISAGTISGIWTVLKIFLI